MAENIFFVSNWLALGQFSIIQTSMNRIKQELPYSYSHFLDLKKKSVFWL
jgi:hypothetical protein